MYCEGNKDVFFGSVPGMIVVQGEGNRGSVGGRTDGLEVGMLQNVVCQSLLHLVLWPLSPLLGPQRGNPPLPLLPQLVVLLPDHFHPPHLLCPDLAEQLSPDLTGIMQETGYDDDPWEVLLSDFKVGSEPLRQLIVHSIWGAGLVQLPVKVGLVGV